MIGTRSPDNNNVACHAGTRGSSSSQVFSSQKIKVFLPRPLVAIWNRGNPKSAGFEYRIPSPEESNICFTSPSARRSPGPVQVDTVWEEKWHKSPFIHRKPEPRAGTENFKLASPDPELARDDGSTPGERRVSSSWALIRGLPRDSRFRKFQEWKRWKKPDVRG